MRKKPVQKERGPRRDRLADQEGPLLLGTQGGFSSVSCGGAEHYACSLIRLI